MIFRHGGYYRTECSMLPRHAVAYAKEDGILSPAALDLWASMIEGAPLPWSRALVETFEEIIESPYTLVCVEQDAEGNYHVMVVHDRPVGGNLLYWGPPEEDLERAYAASRAIPGVATVSTAPPLRVPEGTVYVLTNKKFNAIKVGITEKKFAPVRINDHVSRGWVTEKQFTWESKKRAREVEQSVLSHFWAQGFTSPVTPIDMPQGGSTEVFRLSDVSVQMMIDTIEAHR